MPPDVDRSANGAAHLLLVEDDPELGPLLQEMLTADGYDVLLVREGREVLRLVREDVRLCMILLDLRLRDVDAYELWPRLLAEKVPERVPVYIFSAALHVDEARLPGHAGIIRKPIDVAHLADVLRSACPRATSDAGATRAGAVLPSR